MEESNPQQPLRAVDLYNPYDGFRITVGPAVDDKGRQIGTEVYLEVHGDAKLQEHVVLGVFEQSVAGAARQKRLVQAMDGIADYLNAGGDSQELFDVIWKANPLFQKYKAELPEPWYLLDWMREVSEEKFIFANDKIGKVLIVSPDEYSEFTTMEDLNNALRQSEEEGDGS